MRSVSTAGATSPGATSTPSVSGCCSSARGQPSPRSASMPVAFARRAARSTPARPRCCGRSAVAGPRRWVHARTLDADGFGWVPFQWERVDAYFLMERFGSLRARHGDPEHPVSPAVTAERLSAGLGQLPEPRTLILHPFLLADDGWWSAARPLLRRPGRACRGTGSVSITHRRRARTRSSRRSHERRARPRARSFAPGRRSTAPAAPRCSSTAATRTSSSCSTWPPGWRCPTSPTCSRSPPQHTLVPRPLLRPAGGQRAAARLGAGGDRASARARDRGRADGGPDRARRASRRGRAWSPS